MNIGGNISSTIPMSFEKRLRIRPIIKKCVIKMSLETKNKKDFNACLMDFYSKRSLLLL